jgi:hypothetical protein
MINRRAGAEICECKLRVRASRLYSPLKAYQSYLIDCFMQIAFAGDSLWYAVEILTPCGNSAFVPAK